MAMKLVLRIGGSILGAPPDPSVVSGYSEVILGLARGGHSVAVVVGGGDVARMYIDAAKKLGLSSREQDTIAIQASRVNARLVAMKLGSDGAIPTSIARALALLRGGKTMVMGGLKPGITTDTVATLLAEAWKSDLLVKASNQDGIYTADPRTDSSATLLRSVSYRRLGEILGGEHRPGIHSIVDPVAVEHLIRKRLRLVVLNGKDPKNVLRAVKGEDVGTTVVDA